MVEKNSKLDPDAMLALFDQFETTISNFAPIIATYYSKLVAEGVPPDLAEELTLEWHRIFWEAQLPRKSQQRD